MIHLACILLDHVPHDERSRPTFSNEATQHRSSITLFIPNVRCERCHLQLITIMSDDYHGVPDGQSCAFREARAQSKCLAAQPHAQSDARSRTKCPCSAPAAPFVAGAALRLAQRGAG